jgi:hypothetical protein
MPQMRQGAALKTLISMEYRKAKTTLDDKDWAYDGGYLPDPKTAGLH